MSRNQKLGGEFIDEARRKLWELQLPLGRIVTKADAILNEIYPIAPKPEDVDKDFPVKIISPTSVPHSRRLRINFGASSVAIERNPRTQARYPLRRVELWTPTDNSKAKNINIADSSHKFPDLPFTIETFLYDESRTKLLQVLGFGFADQEKHIDEIDESLDAARATAMHALKGLRGRLRTQRAILNTETFYGIGIGDLARQQDLEP